MGIYHKNTSNITKIADIYLKQTNAITRICKVYICTAANTFELVYDGCAACNCETFCNSFCGGTNSTCYCPCIYYENAVTTTVGPSSITEEVISSFPDPVIYKISGVCGCNSIHPKDWNSQSWINNRIPTSTECTTNWCFIGVGNCPSPGCYSDNFWAPCKDGYTIDENCQGTPDACVCPPASVDPDFCPIIPGGIGKWQPSTLGGPDIVTPEDECEQGVLGETDCIQFNISLVCRDPCCITSPTGGYSACNDYNNTTLNNGDFCCRTKILTGNFSNTSWSTPCYISANTTTENTCCTTNLTCAP